MEFNPHRFVVSRPDHRRLSRRVCSVLIRLRHLITVEVIFSSESSLKHARERLRCPARMSPGILQFALIRFYHRMTNGFSDPVANAGIVQRFFEKAFLLKMKRIEERAQRAFLGVDLVSRQQDIASHFRSFGHVRGF